MAVGNDVMLKQEEKLKNFKEQIERDLDDIKDDYERIDPHLSNKDYAFLFWILLKIYNVEEESVTDFITEYNDKSIDCFVHFEETKELFIIQCKHYAEETKVIRNMVSDFLKTPLAFLDNNNYKRSAKLQKIYNKAKNDPEYRIHLQFYTTNTNYSDDIDFLITDFNRANRDNNKHSDIFDLKEIYNKYYGESYKKSTNLEFSLKTINKGTFASLKEEYGIDYKYQGYYIITPVEQIYNLLKSANDNGYQLFEENIREYLGEGGAINSAIANTLRSEERINFLYYNNGITVIVKKSPKTQMDNGYQSLTLKNPQIVNGCQTVNTIYSVLDDYSEKERKETFKNVFVMTKLLIIPTQEETDKNFYHDVVKYTNKQNPIPDKVFTAANQTVFARIQSELMRYGLWLKVKQSDKIKFDNFAAKDKADMLDKLNETASLLNIKFQQKDICVDLEKILQICLAFITDGYNAFTKKSSVLKANTEIFKKYSINIQDYLSYENIARLYVLYKKAEYDRKKSEDQRTPIPYYVLGFLSFHISDRTDSLCYNKLLDSVFSKKKEDIELIYKYLVNLSSLYRDDAQKDYNVLIKAKIDVELLNKQINIAKKFMAESYNILANS